MKKFSIKDKDFIPAAHSEHGTPNVLKKVILSANETKIEGVVQMINWVKLVAGEQSDIHYHEKMDELLIIISGSVEISVDDETETFEASDSVLIPFASKHGIKNLSPTDDVTLIAIGVSIEPGGKTITV